ncbi:MAG: putative transporter [Rikenellaceae bacterium]
MEIINNFFADQMMLYTCLIISIVTSVGLYLGRLKFFGVSLGITFVFFMGIFAGHLGVNVDTKVLEFAQSFGLAIYGYALGLQVGPSFFPSLRAGGTRLNLMSMAIVVLNVAVVMVLYYALKVPMSQLVGVLSGATTCSPALGAAQQTLSQVSGTGMAISDMASGFAVCYPFGVIGAILVVLSLKGIFKKYNNVESSQEEDSGSTPEIISISVTNPNFNGKPLSYMVKSISQSFNVSRVRRGEDVIFPKPDTTLLLNDILLVMTTHDNIDIIQPLIGEKSNIDWSNDDKDFITKKIYVTQPQVNGKTLGALDIRNKYGVNVTRVSRSGITLLATKNLYLLLGDKVTVVGNRDSLDNVERLLGNTVKKLDEPNLKTIYIGLALGLLLGAIPISIPGISIPVRLGLAGGTVLIGICMGAFGYKFKVLTYTTQSANNILRELGILLYLACLGIQSGGGFAETIMSGSGLMWALYGAMITALPLFLVGYIFIKWQKCDMPTVFGMMCGSMGSPPALSYTTDLTGKESPVIAYAAVYPLTMFIRIIIAQLLIMFFC